MLCWSIFNHSLKTFSRNKCKAYWPALPQAPGGGSAPGTRLAARRSRGCVTVEADQQKVSPPPFVILSHLMGSVWGSQVVFMIKGGGNTLTIIIVIVQLPTAGALSPVPRAHTPHLGGAYAFPSALWPGFLPVQPSRDPYLPFLPSVWILSYFQSLGGHHHIPISTQSPHWSCWAGSWPQVPQRSHFLGVLLSRSQQEGKICVAPAGIRGISLTYLNKGAEGCP